MEQIDWYLEYIKVFAAYAALLYIWPGIIFHRYLNGKGLTFRFLFCNVVQIVLINTVILVLGLLHILNVWIVRALFYGPFIMTVWICAAKRKEHGHPKIGRIVKNLFLGNYGWKLFLARMAEAGFRQCKKFCRNYKGQLMQYVLLIVVVQFGMAYFSNGAFQLLSYGCSDQFTHHQWILGLQSGEVFLNGIYPEAMHCFIYSMNSLFGVKLYSCMLFLAGIHISAFLLAVYCLLKEVFQCGFMPLFVLAAWLSVGGTGGIALESLSRMTWTIPQEFGLYLVFLCPLLLIRFLRGKKEAEQWFQDENLLLLSFGVGATIAVHFYVTILAFFACLAVALAYARKMWPIRRIWLLAAAVLYGTEAGIVPMLAAYVMGKDPEGSLGWGVGTLQGTTKSAAQPQTILSGNLFHDVYRNGYVKLFGERGAKWLAFVSILIIVILCAWGFFLYYKRKKGQKSLLKEGTLRGYFFLAVVSAAYVFLYASPFIGLPEFVAVDRIVSLTQIWALGMLGILADFLFFFAGSIAGRGMAGAAALLGCCAVYGLAYQTDFHEYTYWWLGRYKSEVAVTAKIMDDFPQYSYTVVSMDGALYQIREEGRHEEILTFVQNVERKEYSLPTEYIFLYVEKRPILYAQYFFSGPSWLARDNHRASDNFDNQSPRTEISQKAAERSVSYLPEPLDNYIAWDIRTALNSKAYVWYQDFREMYPVETNVYYEDDDFVCYMIHQNPKSLFNLAVNE